jgi:hypothetical protein
VRVDRQGDLTPARFVGDALQNPVNRAILERLPALGLPDAWLVAGCLFQTVWNVQAGRPRRAASRTTTCSTSMRPTCPNRPRPQ